MPRNFGPNVTIDGGSIHGARGSSGDYEDEVHAQLMGILAFDSGRAVIDEIWGKPHRVRIQPWRGRPQAQPNAEATPTNFRAATMAHRPVRDGEDGHHEAAWGHGAGRGSNVVVHYSPRDWSEDSLPAWDATTRNNWAFVNGVLPPLPGDDAGEVLLHELVHALRQMSGLLDPYPMERGFDTQEEFFAVLVTNIYTSERGRFRQLRADHGTSALFEPQEWSTDREYRALTYAVVISQPSLVRRLARVRAPFNPFAGRYESIDH
jgi:hypothetical protein